MVTSAPGRRVAHALVAVCLAGPAVLLGGVAWADPSPGASPDAGSPPVAPAVQPSIGTWLVGGTLLEGTAAKPVAKPATKPVARPAAPTRGTSTSTQPAASTPGATPAGGSTALPFTGGHLDTLLPAGIALLTGGVVLILVARPRRVQA